MKSLFIPIVIFVFLTGSCHQQTDEKSKERSYIPDEKAMVKANQKAVETEKSMMERYRYRHGWNDAKVTSSGIYYQVVTSGHGVAVRTGDVVTLCYTLKLINGYKCYERNRGNPLTFRVGQSSALPGGMHKLLLHLREGDKVQALIPSYLGYGVAGDGNKVPPKATLVYNFEILKVQNQPH